MSFSLEDFVRESNRIEGILRKPTQIELNAHDALIMSPEVKVDDLCTFVALVAPGHRIRDKPGLNVRVGSHIAPPGGRRIVPHLEDILASTRSAWQQHIEYETLHPFTDGNGRSGRALWLWRIGGIENAPLGFLHHFYYQTLENVGR